MAANSDAMSAMDDVVQEWSTALMKKLYNEKPRFCDIAIKCIDDTLYAHRAVLACRTACAPEPLP